MENMRHRRGGARVDSVNRAHGSSVLTKAVNSVFAFVRLAEFEIIVVLFFIVAFLIFKDLVCVFILVVLPLLIILFPLKNLTRLDGGFDLGLIRISVWFNHLCVLKLVTAPCCKLIGSLLCIEYSFNCK